MQPPMKPTKKPSTKQPQKPITVPPSTYAPMLPEDFIGRTKVVAVALANKCGRARVAPAPMRLLLYGQPGIGKTRLANMVAAMLTNHPTEVHAVNGRNVGLDLVRGWMDELPYRPITGGWTVKVVDEIDTATAAAQDLLLTYLDRMNPTCAFIGTSNLDLRALTERFQSRLCAYRIEAPTSDEIAEFIQARWSLPPKLAQEAAVGCGGNVRAAFLDAETLIDMLAVA